MFIKHYPKDSNPQGVQTQVVQKAIHKTNINEEL